MLTKKLVGAALACALTLGAWSGGALANPVTVGGITFDPASPLDLTIQALNFRENSASNVGDTVMGYGRIGSINGDVAADFCSGCDLTFVFQFTVASVTPVGANSNVVLNHGNIDFYVDNTGSFDVLDPSTAGIGSLWLSLSGHAAPYTGFSNVGELYHTILGPVADPGSGSAGFGLFDATGGAARYLVDTDLEPDGADFRLDSSFQTDDAGICATSGLCYPISGTAQLIGTTNAVAVPEPAALGLLGLGLTVLGVLLGRRRRERDVVC